jgi:hypothetical protein
MSIDTVLKDDLRGVLAALQLGAAGAVGPDVSSDSALFLDGYLLALQAVAVAFGLGQPLEEGGTFRPSRVVPNQSLVPLDAGQGRDQRELATRSQAQFVR